MTSTKPLTHAELEADTAFIPKALIALNRAPATAALVADFADGGLRAAAGGDGGRSSETPDPTGNAATVDRPDQMTVLQQASAVAWREMMQAITRYVGLDHIVHMHADRTDRYTESRIPACVNRNCGEQILPPDKPMSGRCKPCHDYRAQHDRDAPKETVAGRRRQRAFKERQKEGV